MFLPRDALFTYKRYGIRYKHVCLSLCAVCPTAWAQNFAPYPFMAGFLPRCVCPSGPPTCERNHRAVVLSCSHLARRWAALECRSAWLVVDTQLKACSRETHSPSRASIIQMQCYQQWSCNTTHHRTHCGGVALWS